MEYLGFGKLFCHFWTDQTINQENDRKINQ